MSTNSAYVPPRGAVDDFEPVDELVLAERAVRLGAVFVDGIVAFVMIWLPASIVLLATGGVDAALDPDVASLDINVLTVVAVLCGAGFVGWSLVTALLVARNGQTIGKRLLDIKVVRSDGSPASLGRIFWLRNFVSWLLSVIPFYGLIDPLFIFGVRRQCIHDLIADTIVVRA